MQKPMEARNDISGLYKMMVINDLTFDGETPKGNQTNKPWSWTHGIEGCYYLLDI
jgi:hypothetical protein